MYKGVFGMPAA